MKPLMSHQGRWSAVGYPGENRQPEDQELQPRQANGERECGVRGPACSWAGAT